ncbi:acetylcholine receptor subunit alpha-L1-like isoform X4 [Ctenocephalides felis]|uniref:acetylcholine receptor subunit alpha-L1-like isoform X4 n=1 Tax=Ctenocephalides felis TaxID=7515 RepID=UPI000E6E4BA6|nr:acetylcholine receptor subunit alpha-L1-like isoform X4 [Ctenocephalides felis]
MYLTKSARSAIQTLLVFLVLDLREVICNPDAKRLYDDLLSTYNRLIRPVSNNTDTVLVKLGLRLSQLIDLNLKDQILTTNVWLEHEWQDHKFQWDPTEYGGVTELYVPSEHIWLPDIVLYNNADGEYVVTTMTKAVLHHTGKVVWTPPAIFKSSCEIDVRYFPFDQQTCFMKFGSWTYDGDQIDLKHINQKLGDNKVEVGIDLREYYPSVEWDILGVPAERHEKYYPCCAEPYPDIFFNITLRRKTLFYTVNLIVPCVGISYLSVLVFYLPADSGEKIALCISILLSQTMFFLLISEIIPSTSLALPLLGKYLLFTMLLVGLSVVITIIILNVHYRKPSTHKMAPWVRKFFIKRLPKLLLMRVPKDLLKDLAMNKIAGRGKKSIGGGYNGLPSIMSGLDESLSDVVPRKKYPFELEKAIHNVMFIQHHMLRQDEFNAEDQDWGFVAMVLDRLFLWIFTIASIVGTFAILCEAPALYDDTKPIDMELSSVAQQQFLPDV